MRTSLLRPRRLTRRRLLALAGAVTAARIGVAALPPANAVAAPPIIAGTAGEAGGTAGASTVQQTLPNGLLVLVQERRSAGTVALQHTTLAGARDDSALPGTTVLTSRMLLQGTPRYPTELALQRAATLAGGTLERGTTSEYSNIACVMPAPAAETAFDLVSDVVLNPLLDRSAFAGQRLVALKDLAQRRDDPNLLIGDLFQATIFAGQPLGLSPLGTPDSLAAMTLDDIRANLQRLWGAANAVVTVVGRIAPQDAFDLAGQYFGGLQTGTTNVRQPTQVSPPSSAETVQATAGQQVQARIGFTAPSLQQSDRYPLAVLTEIMSGFSGRLLQALRGKLGLAFTPYAGYSPYSDAGAWYASTAVDPSNLDRVLEVTRTEIERIRDAPADDSEVSDAISAIAGQRIVASEGNAAVAGQLAVQQILGDVPLDEFVHRAQMVTAADVQRVAQTYLDLDHSLTALVGPAVSQD